jgi:hypothetical protein
VAIFLLKNYNQLLKSYTCKMQKFQNKLTICT